MRAGASSAGPAVAATAFADASSAGSAGGALGALASSDGSSDSSQSGASGQPFASALASAQADSTRNQETKTGAPILTQTTDAEALLKPQQARTPAGKQEQPVDSEAAAAGAGRTACDIVTTAIAIKACAESADDALAVPSKVAGDESATQTSTTSKARSGKHIPTAEIPDQSVLSTLAALFATAAVPSSAALPATQGMASPQQSAAGTGSATAGAPAAVASAAQHRPTNVAFNTVAANSSTELTALNRPMTSSTAATSSVSTGSSTSGRMPEVTVGNAPAGNGLAPMIYSLTAVTNAAAGSTPASIRVPVSDSTWPNALAAQVQWMATRQVQSATVRLWPEHLGPLEVRIDVMGSQINVNFTAHHADTREALAQAVPQLRQLFSAGGLNLGEATVRQEPRSSEQQLLPQSSSATAARETVEPVANTAIQRIGLVDEYA